MKYLDEKKLKYILGFVLVYIYGCTSPTTSGSMNTSVSIDSVDNRTIKDRCDKIDSVGNYPVEKKQVCCSPDSVFYIDGVEFYHNRLEDVSHLLGCWSWSGEFTELQFFKDKMSWPDTNLGEFYPYYVHGDTIEMPNNIFDDVSYKYRLVGDTLILVDLSSHNNDPLIVVRFNP